MANALYAKGRQKFLEGSIAWLTDNIKVVGVDSADYTPNLTTDEFLSDIPAIGRVATSANLTTKTSAAGVADSDDPSFVGATGDQFEYLAIYKDSGVAATSPLIALIDTATGLPVTPNTSDIAIQWDNGSNKIFKL